MAKSSMANRLSHSLQNNGRCTHLASLEATLRLAAKHSVMQEVSYTSHFLLFTSVTHARATTHSLSLERWKVELT